MLRFMVARKHLSNAGWLLRFAVAMLPLVWLVGTRYLLWVDVDGPLPAFYLLLMYLGHLSLLPILALLPLLLLTWLPPRIFRGLAITTILLLLTLLLIDTVVYELYRFHINGFILEMVLLSGTDTFELSSSLYLSALAGLVLLLLVLLALAGWLVPRLGQSFSVLVLSLTLLGLMAAHGIHAWADANYDGRITAMSRHIPLYFGATSKRLFIRYGVVDAQQQRDSGWQESSHAKNAALRYPTEPLVCQEVAVQPNILLIVVDALRADTVTKKWMPNTKALQQQSLDFSQHFSGGNSTLAGIFSLFYGLPANYWSAFYGEHRPPVVLDRLTTLGYQPIILSAATLVSPAFDRTVFAGIADIRLHTPGNKNWDKDQRITDDWLAFTASDQATARPFFGFLFYSAVHGYSTPPDYPHFQPYWSAINQLQLSADFDPLPYQNVYRTAAHYVDMQIGRVLEDLRQRDLLANTLVMVTSDHGEEFNDNGLNFWGHGSNFSDTQLRVPMIVHWPGKKPAKFNYRTSHNDVAVTLMSELLGCQSTKPDSYAVGHSLFQQQGRGVLIAGSYAGYAAVLEKYVLVSYPSGSHELLDKHLKPVKDDILQPETGRQVLEQLSRFYR